MIDISKYVNYKREYGMLLKVTHISGKQMMAHSPFHRDERPSFSVNSETGQWIDFTTGESGNFVTFIAKMENLSNKETFKLICDRYGINEKQKKAQQSDKRQDADSLQNIYKEIL